MSASIYWAPASQQGTWGKMSTPSRFIIEIVMEGRSECVFDRPDLLFLRGVVLTDPAFSEAFHQLEEAINVHGAIRVFVMY